MKGVQCYELFGGIALKNHAFSLPMDVIVRSNNNPVNDMTTHVSGLINDLDKVIKTKSSQSLFG